MSYRFKCGTVLLMGLVIVFACVAVTAEAVLPENIVGAWFLDEGDGPETSDATVHGHVGTIMGAPEWVDGRSDAAKTALTFNGGGDYVDCGATEEMSLDVFSVSFWVNIPQTQGWNHIVSRGSHVGGGNPGAVNWGVMMVSNEPIILFEVFNNTGWTGVRANTNTEEWHHVVATYDGDLMQLYHDGIMAASTAGAGVLLDDTRPFMIGAKSDGGGPSSYFNGTVDEVGYFNVVLTEDDILTLMNDGLVEMIVPSAVSPGGKMATTWSQLSRCLHDAPGLE